MAVADHVSAERETPLTASSISSIHRIVRAVRVHLGMDVAYLSEFVRDRSVFRVVDSDLPNEAIFPGASIALRDTYCQHILTKRLPQLIANTCSEPFASTLAATSRLPIGAHLSVPITMGDGTVFGMLCCLSAKPDETLNKRDLDTLRAFAELAAVEAGRDFEVERQLRKGRIRVEELFRPGVHTLVFQPIVRLEDDKVTGFECLSRFSGEISLSPDKWFAEAKRTGLGIPLELAAVKKGLASLDTFSSEISLSLNASAEVVLDARFAAMLADAPVSRLILEITEHEAIDDYSALCDALMPLRRAGMRLSIDDAGSGYASFRHILSLSPDFIKLDISLTRNIDRDTARRALASALITFSRQTGSKIVAEGVESVGELNTLRQLGVEKAQGYLLSRPICGHDAVRMSGSFLREPANHAS